MRENEWLNRMEHVWLIDHETGARTDLLRDDYTFAATTGTTAGRLAIQGVFRAPQEATGNESLESEGLEFRAAHKVMIDRALYIRIGDKTYDATGRLITSR